MHKKFSRGVFQRWGPEQQSPSTPQGDTRTRTAAGYANNDPLVQFDCTTNDNFLFSLVDVGGGYYQLKAKHSGKCVSVSGPSTADNQLMVQFDCFGGTNQRFRFSSPGKWCVTVSGSAEWCGPVPGVVRYTTSTPGNYTVRLNSVCGGYSGGQACQYELLRDGVEVTDSGVGRWYSTNISSYTAGECPAAEAPIACGVRSDQNVTLP